MCCLGQLKSIFSSGQTATSLNRAVNCTSSFRFSGFMFNGEQPQYLFEFQDCWNVIIHCSTHPPSLPPSPRALPLSPSPSPFPSRLYSNARFFNQSPLSCLGIPLSIPHSSYPYWQSPHSSSCLRQRWFRRELATNLLLTVVLL